MSAMDDSRTGSPTAATRGGLVRVAARFGPPPEPVDVVAGVEPLARRPGRRLRADVSAADVGIERRAADAEQACGVAGVDPRSVIEQLILIDRINVDTIDTWT